MSFGEIAIYCIQFLALSYFILFSKIWHCESPMTPWGRYGLWIATIACSLYAAFLQTYYFGGDPAQYLRSAQRLTQYIAHHGWTHLDVLLFWGGKDYPTKHAAILDQIDVAKHASSVLMVKVYALFGTISSFHYVNISLWFGFTSFVGKFISFRIMQKLSVPIEAQRYWFIALMILPVDHLMVSGMYKETLAFTIIMSILLLYIHKGENLKLFALLSLMLVLLYNIRTSFFVFLFISYSIYIMNILFSRMKRIFIFQLATICIIFYQLGSQLLGRAYEQIIGFRAECVGLLKLPPLDWTQHIWSIASNVFLALYRILWYTPNGIHWPFYMPFLILGNLTLIILLSLLFYRLIHSRSKHRLSFLFLTIVPALLNLLLIGCTVCNFGTIVRYRSIFVYLLIFGSLIQLYHGVPAASKSKS